MNERGALLGWHRQGKTEVLGEKRHIAELCSYPIISATTGTAQNVAPVVTNALFLFIWQQKFTALNAGQNLVLRLFNDALPLPNARFLTADDDSPVFCICQAVLWCYHVPENKQNKMVENASLLSNKIHVEWHISYSISTATCFGTIAPCSVHIVQY